MEDDNSAENRIVDGETSNCTVDVKMQASADGDVKDVEMHVSSANDDGKPNDSISVDVPPKEDEGRGASE